MSKNIKVKKRKFDTSSMQNDKECSSAEVEQIEDTILEEELKAEKKKIDDMKKQIECPVCHEVPRTGPIFACPNGHLVCEKCKRESCPTCRAVMGDYRSLLTVAVIERILHDCKNDECDDMFPHHEIEHHEKNCKHRVVAACPFNRTCTKETTANVFSRRK